MAVVLLVITLFGFFSFLFKGADKRPIRRRLLISGALIHNVGTTVHLLFPNYFSIPPYISVDGVGALFLIITSFIFTLVAFYSLGYLPLNRQATSDESGGHIYISCLLFFLAAMTLSICTEHIGILWISIEAATLASAPLIYYRQNQRSLEAAWKYLLVCSVGIAVALLGIFFVVASSHGSQTDLSVGSLVKIAGNLDKNLLRMGFILILIGFGTKMGLAPLHNWLPDAYSEAPAPICALLSGSLLNCALLGIIRFVQICNAASLRQFSEHLLILFGLSSLIIAAVFMTAQKNYKRMFAYSSIEHIGIIILGIGIGANFASMLHVAAHSITKALLFLVAGNILILYKSKKTSEVRGLLRTSPETGSFLVIGTFAILGLPPFLPFISEFLILKHGIAHGNSFSMFIYVLTLAIIFVSMSKVVLKMLHGRQRDDSFGALPKFLLIPPAILSIFIILLGVYLPEPLAKLIESAGNLFQIL